MCMDLNFYLRQLCFPINVFFVVVRAANQLLSFSVHTYLSYKPSLEFSSTDKSCTGMPRQTENTNPTAISIKPKIQS